MLTDFIQTQGSTVSINIVDSFLSLGFSVLLSLAVIGIYRWTHRGMHYERSFLTTLLLMGPVVCVIMMMIGGNIALSLGMVGALSIVRFRTAVKDSRDMIYLFWLISIGLGCGTYMWDSL